MRYFLFILILYSCDVKQTGPELVIKNFIESRISHTVSREFVLEQTTGKLRQIVENMSEEDFDRFRDLKKFKKDYFKIHSKSCTEKKCFITYSLGYKAFENNQPLNVTEVKKIAELEQVNGKWLIADVSNVKSYIESFQPIEALEDK